MISGSVSKSVANRSTTAGRSMTRKSVTDGSPPGPRSAGRSPSSCSKKESVARNRRRSAVTNRRRAGDVRLLRAARGPSTGVATNSSGTFGEVGLQLLLTMWSRSSGVSASSSDAVQVRSAITQCSGRWIGRALTVSGRLRTRRAGCGRGRGEVVVVEPVDPFEGAQLEVRWTRRRPPSNACRRAGACAMQWVPWPAVVGGSLSHPSRRPPTPRAAVQGRAAGSSTTIPSSTPTISRVASG